MFIEKLGLSRNILREKIAIITGSGRGIGKELAKNLAWLGAHVIIAEINESGKDVENEILSEGGSATFIKLDVSNESDIHSLENYILSTFGKIDILINNAIVYSAGSFEELAISDWDNAFSVNVRGAVFLTKIFLPHMIKQNSGVINYVTSAEGTPYMAPYFASKAALSSIGQSLAAEVEGSGVNVFIFAPGMVDTPGLKIAAKLLAPRFGMTEHEFLNQGVNPGYDDLMPPEHCAAGWAFTIVHSKDYHGQIADPFGILLSKGLITKTGESELQKEELMAKKPTLINDIDSIKSAIGPVENILDKIEKETENLGVFAKKWVYRNFAKRCGLNFEKYKLELSKMQEKLFKTKNLIKGSDFEGFNHIASKFPWYYELLTRLGKYIELSKKDAKGWLKDPIELNIALNELDNREEAVDNLQNHLKLIMEHT